MNILIAPDSFKGTLSALEAARAIEIGIKAVLPTARTFCLPLADGGEGTLDALLFATHGERKTARVSDANGDQRDTSYGVFADAQGAIAVLEAAQIVGLNQARVAVGLRTTQGVGELLRHGLDQGLRRFLIGLGGSSTNDGGAGLLAALGVALSDAAGNQIAPHPQGLSALARVDFSGLDTRLSACDISVLTDVDIPLCGPSGATAMFGPQKGVQPEQVAPFDQAIAHLAQHGDAWAGRAVSQMPGAGAAGGLGYALMLLGAKRRPGAEVVCEKMQVDAHLRDADWLITGEGRSDAQTLHGKLPVVVARHAQRAKVRAILLSGVIDAEHKNTLAQYFVASYSVVGDGVTSDQAVRDPARYLSERASSVANWIAQTYSSPESKIE